MTNLTVQQRTEALRRVASYGGDLTPAEQREISTHVAGVLNRGLRQMVEGLSRLGTAGITSSEHLAVIRNDLWDEESLAGWQRRSVERAERRRAELEAAERRRAQRRLALRMLVHELIEFAVVLVFFAVLIFFIWLLLGPAT